MGGAAAGVTVATWSGAINLAWENAGNWSPAAVPLNSINNEFSVRILAANTGPGLTMTDGAITDLLLGLGANVSVQGRSLEVVGAADLNGAVFAVNGDFIANSPATVLRSGALLLRARGVGADLVVGAQQLDFAEQTAREIEFSAWESGRLTLSDLALIDASSANNRDGLLISAQSGGRIDLSGLTEIIASPSAQRPVNVFSQGGTIDLDSLERLGGGYSHILVTSSLAMPSLIHLDRSRITMENGAGTLSMPNVEEFINTAIVMSGSRSLHIPAMLCEVDALIATPISVFDLSNNALFSADFVEMDIAGLNGIPGAGMQVRSGSTFRAEDLGLIRAPVTGFTVLVGSATLDVPALSAITGYLRVVSSNAAVTLPALTSFERMAFVLEGSNSSIDAPLLATLDNLELDARFGARYESKAPSYRSDFTQTAGTSGAIFAASGNGSVLDLASIQTIDARYDLGAPGMSGRVQRVLASDSGRIDLVSLESLLAPVNPANLFEFQTSGGSIRLGLAELTSGVQLSAFGGGAIEFVGDVVFSGSLRVQANSTFRFHGDYGATGLDPIEVRLTNAIMEFSGSGIQRCEAMSADLGAVAPSSDNFGIGTLRIGGAGAPAAVELRDDASNAGRGASGEAVYATLLDLREGATLYINGVPFYTLIQGVPTNVETLFPPGSDSIVFGEGMIVRGAAPECSGDTNGDMIVNFTDLNSVLTAFGQVANPGEIPADLNDDGVVDFADLNAVLSDYGTDCS